MERTHLIKLREARGLSREAVARSVALSERTVRRAENGQGMALTTARALAEYYGLSLEDVVGMSTTVAAEVAAAEAP